MHLHRSVLAAVALALALPAQAGAAKPAASPPGYDQLVADWKTAQDAFQAAQKAMMASDAYKEARTKKDREALAELTKKLPTPDTEAFGKRALDAAAKCQGDDALKFLQFAADNLRSPAIAKQVVAEIQAKYLGSEKLTGILENGMALASQVGADEAKAFLKGIVETNKHALPRAWATYWQAMMLQSNRQATDADKEAAARLMADAEKLAEGSPLAERIAAPRFEKEHLQIGMAVPDIAGEDVDGVAFKLSDYRGKVVVLDFWGFW